VASGEHEKFVREAMLPLEIDETAMIGEVEAAALHARTRNRLAGDTFGRYKIQKTLGEGAMGSVYLATDTQLQRKVALKIPKINAKEHPRFIERFLREARSAATLSHPNICPVFDVGEFEGQHFITMAYVQGHSLADFVNPNKPQNERHIATVVRKIAMALNEAHNYGLIHRDVKPANVMIDQRNEPIIMDFGLARQVDDEDDARLTRDGAILGSPAYMSPEQIEGVPEKIGPACDIYSLGVILYELLTGQLPFQGSVASIIGQILSKDPEHPTKIRPQISQRLADICLKAMAKKVENRFATMKDFANALADFLKSKTEETKSKSEEAKPKPEETLERVRGLDKPKSSIEKASPQARGSDASSTPTGLRPLGQLEVMCNCGQRMVAKPQMAGKLVRCPRCAEILQVPGPGTSTQQLSITCRQCGEHFLARFDLAGKTVKCPVCTKPLTVPKPGTASSTLPQIEVTCVCGQQFLARYSLAGKRAKCTACGRPIDIPQPE
jgi:serine/threonine protein kinase